MPSYITIDRWCEVCGHRYVDTLTRDEATYENRWDCVTCSGQSSVKRIPSGPKVLVASWPDGLKRSSTEDLKLASKMRVEAASAPPEEKKMMEKEASKLESHNK